MNEENQDKLTKIKDILPILWSSYEHLYFARDNNINNNINFLMIVATFLPIFCLMLYESFNSNFFLFPVVFQILALLILFKKFFIKGNVPWLEYNDTLKLLDDNSFPISLFATLKTAENETYKRLIELRKIIQISLLLLIFSIFLTVLAYFFYILEGSIYLYIVTGALILVFIFIYFFYKQEYKFEFNKEENKIKEDIKKWVENHGRNENNEVK